MLLIGEKLPVPYALAPDNQLTTFDRGQDNQAQSFAIGDTWLVSPQTAVAITRSITHSTPPLRPT
jgi:hypothetical protein